MEVLFAFNMRHSQPMWVVYGREKEKTPTVIRFLARSVTPYLFRANWVAKN